MKNAHAKQTEELENLTESELLLLIKKTLNKPTPTKLEEIDSVLTVMENLGDASEDMEMKTTDPLTKKFFEVATQKIDQRRKELEGLYNEKYRHIQRRNLAIGLTTAGVVTALLLGGITLSKNNGTQKVVNKPSIGNTAANNGAITAETAANSTAPNKAEVIKNINSLLDKYKLNEPSSAEKLYNLLNDGPIMNTEDYDDAFMLYNALVIQSYYDGSTNVIDLVAASQPNQEAQTEVLKAKAAIEPLITNPNKKTTALYALNALATINGYNDEFRGQSSRSHLLITELYRNGYVIVAENGLEKTTLDLKKVEDQGITAIPYKLEGPVLFTVDKLATDLVTEEKTALMQDNAELIQEIKVRTRK